MASGKSRYGSDVIAFLVLLDDDVKIALHVIPLLILDDTIPDAIKQ
jgi:hypothetical protein